MSSSKDDGAAFAQGALLITMPLLSMMGAILMAPLLPRMQAHFHDVPHADLLVPLLLTAPALCQALLSPVAGTVIDRLGSRRILYWALGLYGLAGIAPMVLESLPAIFASRVVVGITEAALDTAVTALLGHYFSGDDRQKWFAYQQMVLPLILVALLQLTGRIGDFNWRATFAAYAISWLMLLGAVAVFRSAKAEPRDAVKPTVKAFPPWRVNALIISVAVPTSILFYAAPVEIGFILDQRGFGAPSTVANALTIGVLAGPLGALLSRKLTRISTGRLLAGSAALMALGLAMVAMATALEAIIGGMALQQLGGCLMFITGMTYFGNIAPVSERGRYAGAWWFVYLLANFAVPLITGFFRHVFGTHSASLIAMALLSVAPIAWFLASRHFRQAIVKQDEPLHAG